MSTSGSSSTSITASRSVRPTCGAASPMPLRGYIVSNMSSISVRSSSVICCDGLRLLAQDRVAEDADVENAHGAASRASAWRARAVRSMRAMRPRSTTSRDSPDLIVTRSSIVALVAPSLLDLPDVHDLADDAAGGHDLDRPA